MGDIFSSTSPFSSGTIASLLDYARQHGLSAIPAFRMTELQKVLRNMKNRKCADADGVVVELFKYGNTSLHQTLLDKYNTMITTGILEPTWQDILFAMLPKQGDLSVASNWRPITILKITYNIFAIAVLQIETTSRGTAI